MKGDRHSLLQHGHPDPPFTFFGNSTDLPGYQGTQPHKQSKWASLWACVHQWNVWKKSAMIWWYSHSNSSVKKGGCQPWDSQKAKDPTGHTMKSNHLVVPICSTSEVFQIFFMIPMIGWAMAARHCNVEAGTTPSSPFYIQLQCDCSNRYGGASSKKLGQV